jgi:topoisomerase-4 subunit A
MTDIQQPSQFDDSDGAPRRKRKKANAPAPAAPPPAAPSPPPPSSDEKELPDGPLHRLMDDNFLQYASYVIRDRAIPEIEDGLKPVQRRILFSLNQNDDGRSSRSPTSSATRCSSIPTATLHRRRPRHPRQPRLPDRRPGQLRQPPHRDPAAAPRYIECRLTDLAATQLFNDDLTDFIPTYDGRRKEPVVLPAKLPLLLMLGAEGIAVGLSTRILPHNFGELLQAQIAILQRNRSSPCSGLSPGRTD